MSKKIQIYSDGACRGNPGPGGWSFIIKYGSGITEEFSGSENKTTNNRMELTAAIEAMKKTNVLIYLQIKQLTN